MSCSVLSGEVVWLLARHRLGALSRHIDALAGAAGADALPPELLDLGRAAVALLAEAGPTMPPGWRALAWGSEDLAEALAEAEQVEP